jgi:hypothetical protein
VFSRDFNLAPSYDELTISPIAPRVYGVEAQFRFGA